MFAITLRRHFLPTSQTLWFFFRIIVSPQVLEQSLFLFFFLRILSLSSQRQQQQRSWEREKKGVITFLKRNMAHEREERKFFFRGIGWTDSSGRPTNQPISFSSSEREREKFAPGWSWRRKEQRDDEEEAWVWVPIVFRGEWKRGRGGGGRGCAVYKARTYTHIFASETDAS